MSSAGRRCVRWIGIASALAVLFVGSSGCAGKAPVREVTPRDLLARAEEKIERGNHLDAVEILTSLTIDHPGVAFIDRVVFQLGRAHLESGAYAEAEAEFRRLTRDYPFSEFADDAGFLIGEAYFRQRGKPALDPTMAETAMAELLRFRREHPGSELVPKARENVGVLREFLAEKAFSNGRQYVRLHRPASAVIYFEKVFEEYPDTAVTPRALLELARVRHDLDDRSGACDALALLGGLPPTAAREAALAGAAALEIRYRCHETTAGGSPEPDG